MGAMKSFVFKPKRGPFRRRYRMRVTMGTTTKASGGNAVTLWGKTVCEPIPWWKVWER